MTAYYNEIDPAAAQWLRNLIEAGHIAPGYVDERSIEDVYPSDLRGFTQCHFFAGIGVWSYALRSAGWSDDRPVWTGSCPCQPFSAAGKGAGFADERHLWPAFHHLIKECKPSAILGEQVASKDADAWIDLVHADVEALGYAFGAVPFPSAGVGAPHIRDRLYWVADSQQHYRGRQAKPANHGQPQADRPADRIGGCGRAFGRVGHASGQRLAQRVGIGGFSGITTGGSEGQAVERAGIHVAAGPRPVNGFWRDADWLACRDGKWRPVEPGTQPLVDGAPARVVRLRAYGNSITAPAAEAFISSVMESVNGF